MTAAPRMMRASSLCDRPEILQDPGGDADAGGRQRRAKEDVRVDACRRQQPDADAKAENERADDAKRRDNKRRDPDAHHLRDGGLQANLEEQQNHAEARQHVDACVSAQVLECRHPDQPEVSDEKSRGQLTEHRRLAEPGSQVASELGCDQDQGHRQDQRRNGVAGAGGALRSHGRHGEDEQRDDGGADRGQAPRMRECRTTCSHYRPPTVPFPEPRRVSQVRNAASATPITNGSNGTPIFQSNPTDRIAAPPNSRHFTSTTLPPQAVSR